MKTQGEWAVLQAERDALAARVAALERELADERAKVADLESTLAAIYDELRNGALTPVKRPGRGIVVVACDECDREYQANRTRCPGCGSYLRRPIA